MKKLILLLLITNLSFSQQWSKKEIKDLISIEFPTTPEEYPGVEKVRFYSEQKENTYKLTIRETERFKLLKNPTKRNVHQVYKDYTAGYISGGNGKIIQTQNIKIHGYEANETIYTTSKTINYRRTFLLKNKLVIYEFIARRGKNKTRNEKLKNTFFNSLKVII